MTPKEIIRGSYNAPNSQKQFHVVDSYGINDDMHGLLGLEIRKQIEAEQCTTNIKVNIDTGIFYKSDSQLTLSIEDADTGEDGGYIHIPGYAEIRHIYIDEDGYIGNAWVDKTEAFEELQRDNLDIANGQNKTVLCRYDIIAIPLDLANNITAGDQRGYHPLLEKYDEVDGGIAYIHPQTTCPKGDHDWQETGRRGNGGGVILCYICKECNMKQTYNSWAQHTDGSQGHITIAYDDSEVEE